MTSLAEWFDAHTAAAPPALRERAWAYLHAAVNDCAASFRNADVPNADVLAAAGASALDAVTSHPGDRSAALDLLAADALITLALLEQAERAPAGLAEFAADLLRRHGHAA